MTAACSLLPSSSTTADGHGDRTVASTAAPLGGTAARRFLPQARFLSGRYDLRAYQLAPALLQLSLGQAGVWALDRVSVARGEIPAPVPKEGLVAFGRGAQEEHFPAGFVPAKTPFLVDLGSFLRELHEERGLRLPPGLYTVVVEGRFTPLDSWPPQPRELSAGDRFELTLTLTL